MASVWKRGRFWYISYFDRSGARVTTSSRMTHRRDAHMLASRLEADEILALRGGMEEETPRRADSLQTLLGAWEKNIVGRGNTAKHASSQRMMAARLLAGCESPADIRPSVITAALAKLHDEPPKLNANSLNHYLRSIKSFVRWLHRDGRITRDPISTMHGYRTAADPRRPRRAFSMEEVGRLCEAAERAPRVLGVTGHDRAMLYLLMLNTGFRLNEVRTLRVKNFDWDETYPTVTVYAGYSKRRREDCQPIRKEVAGKLKAWINQRKLTADDLVLPLPDKPNRLLTFDLKLADIPIKDAHGRYVDLHALRHTFVTECARHFPASITQQLARHASITTTMQYYVHLEKKEVMAALSAARFLQEKPDQRGK